ncbi:MAG TPA: DUF4234 domain-containing protein [Oscillospiraceae bacterium]|nr:DUF4234 domain-containing protein [Oscillospiraceae bacterium]
MFCKNCGKEIPDNATFCTYCGAQTGTPQQQAQHPQQPVYQQPTYQQQNYQQQNYQQQNYQANNYQQPIYRSSAPVGQLKTNRGLGWFILYSIITFGIYPIVFFTGISNDINVIASRYDGRKTMHYCLLFFLVAPITFGIAGLVWSHNISDRIGNELKRRRIPYNFSSSDFWLWGFLGSLIIVGPFIYIHKLAEAINQLAINYNTNG